MEELSGSASVEVERFEIVMDEVASTWIATPEVIAVVGEARVVGERVVIHPILPSFWDHPRTIE